jgi:hypothetical protein
MPVPTVPQDLPAESPKHVWNLCPGNRTWCEWWAPRVGCASPTTIALLTRPFAKDRVLMAGDFPERGEEIL